MKRLIAAVVAAGGITPGLVPAAAQATASAYQCFQKIEGDALTPQGGYRFQFMFGVKANPGVHFPWRHAYRYDYWDDDPASPRYNLWTDTRHHNAGANPEPMHNVPVYNYAAVIAYNLARSPGAGSAIFLHVGDGHATTASFQPQNQGSQERRRVA